MTPRLYVFLLLSLCLPYIPATSRTKPLHSLTDQRCPCKEARNCDMKFSKMNPAAHFAVLKFIPSCPSFQGRCCTAEMMLLTIIELSQSPSPPPILNPRHNNHHSVTCVRVKDCPANNIYGTNSLHFEQFGFISPSESDCQATQDNILCIVPAQTQDTKTALTQDTKSRTGELPCVLPSSCSEVYGVAASHFTDHGLQFACPNDQEVRCLAVQNTKTNLPATTTTPPLILTATELPCLPTSSCSEVYGTLGSHFTDYGLQFKCARTDYVRCIVGAQPTTTRRTTRRTTSTPAPTVPSPSTTELPCHPPSSCSEVYGTLGSHFTDYGLQFKCERTDYVRCIVGAQPTTTRRTTRRTTSTPAPTVPSPSTTELPCHPPSLCSEVYGTLGSHFTDYGLQFKCERTDYVRCIVGAQHNATSTTSAQATTIPGPSTAELPCLNPSSCAEVYGTLRLHFTVYGLQFRCPQSNQVRCVSSGTITTRPITTRPTTTRRTTTVHPLFTTCAPVTAPPPSVVNIIGPRPIYIGLNNNQGPAFHQVGSSQSLSIHTDTKEQIRNLLELLDERLKQISKRYPTQD